MADSNTTARRIQRKRSKGWRMPSEAVYVGRPSKWGNPFNWLDWREQWPFQSPTPHPWTDTTDRDRWCKEQATQEFKTALECGEVVLPLTELRGRTLACWCRPNEWCHADVLWEAANAE